MRPSKIRYLWKRFGWRYWWGDPLDVRFELCRILSGMKNRRILDIGCNIGITLACADDSNQKYGFDLNEDAIERAKGLHDHLDRDAVLEVKDAFKADLVPNSFDVVVLANILEMFDREDPNSEQSPRKLLDDAIALLRKGGLLLITTPNGNAPYHRKKNKITEPELHDMLDGLPLSYELQGWNPLPIEAGHLLRFVPGIFVFLRALSRWDIGRPRVVSFLVKAQKT